MAWLIGEGGYIMITLTEALTGTITGNQSHFTVSWYEYEYAPDGTNLIPKTSTVLSTFIGESDTSLILEVEALQRFYNAVGLITVSYDGLGTLAGNGGPVEAFSQSFTPVDLVMKPHQGHSEHFNISNISSNCDFVHVYYSEASGSDHFEISNITANVAFIDVGDL